MTTSTVPAPAPAFPDRFRARAGAGATLTFAEFMALALYDPEVGYYRGGRPRVGRNEHRLLDACRRTLFSVWAQRPAKDGQLSFDEF